jgi:hypothetical protein
MLHPFGRGVRTADMLTFPMSLTGIMPCAAEHNMITPSADVDGDGKGVDDTCHVYSERGNPSMYAVCGNAPHACLQMRHQLPTSMTARQ